MCGGKVRIDKFMRDLTLCKICLQNDYTMNLESWMTVSTKVVESASVNFDLVFQKKSFWLLGV